MRVLFVCLCLISLLATHAGTNIASDKPHAWSAYSAWINVRGDITNGVIVGDCFLSGHAWSGNAGWIHFGDGAAGNVSGNYDIVAGNRYGPIVDISIGGGAAVSGNSAASSLTSTDSSANFAH